MPDPRLPEDDAASYVLGGLSAEDRREFETRLAESEELRALVRELEDATVALTLASPPKRAPQRIWTGIEKAVAQESKSRSAAFWFGWLRNGWAAASICWLGWVLYAFLAHRPASDITTSKTSDDRLTAAISPTPTQALPNPLSSPSNAAMKLLQARAQELAELRRKIAQMETERTQLSRWLARQSAALSESNRIKFCQLVPASVNTDGSAPPLSPGLQRAMLMAIARELGWFESKPGAPDDSRFGQTPFSIDGIDFVNLHPNTNGVAYQAPPQPSAQSTATPQTTIPGFVAGNKLVLAVDSTVAPPQSSVTFTVTDANQNQTGGTVVLGDNPTVVTIPLTAEFAQGGVAPGPFIPTGLIPTPDGYLAVTVSSLSSSGIFSTNWFIMPANP